MIFGKIDYLNLLPFHVFLKRHLQNTRMQSVISYKKGVPSEINKAFKKRRIDAAFISSIESRGFKCTDLGIVAKKEVLSVLVIQGESAPDSESATSNALAQLLEIKGQVIIGDKALRYYLQHPTTTDLAKVWYETYHLPFVFARLCYHTKKCQVAKLVRGFKRHNQKIPYYILQKASQKSAIPPKEIRHYLTKISYTLDSREKKSLARFLKSTKPRRR